MRVHAFCPLIAQFRFIVVDIYLFLLLAPDDTKPTEERDDFPAVGVSMTCIYLSSAGVSKPHHQALRKHAYVRLLGFWDTHFFSLIGLLSLRAISDVNCLPGGPISGLAGVPDGSALGLSGTPAFLNFGGIVFSVF